MEMIITLDSNRSEDYILEPEIKGGIIVTKNDGKIIGNTIIDLSILELKFKSLYELLLKKEVITEDEFNKMLKQNMTNIDDIIKAKMDLTRIEDNEIL